MNDIFTIIAVIIGFLFILGTISVLFNKKKLAPFKNVISQLPGLSPKQIDIAEYILEDQNVCKVYGYNIINKIVKDVYGDESVVNTFDDLSTEMKNSYSMLLLLLLREGQSGVTAHDLEKYMDRSAIEGIRSRVREIATTERLSDIFPSANLSEEFRIQICHVAKTLYADFMYE